MPEPISIDDFKKIEIRVGEIRNAGKIEGSDKLLRLIVNFGDHERQVLSGIAQYIKTPEELIGKRCPFVTNLPPRVMMGIESQAMLLAGGGEEDIPFALFETKGLPGTRIR